MRLLPVHIHLTKKKRNKALDQLMLGLSFIYPISGIPQVLDIWRGDGKASIITWLCFLLATVLGLAYGLIHRLSPIIISNFFWLVIDSAIVAGLLWR